MKFFLKCLGLLTVLFLVLEVLSVAVLYITLSYKPYDYHAVMDDLSAQIALVTFANHWDEFPYLGFRRQEEASGIEKAMSKPKKPQSEYWVGIFGGSLASMFSTDNNILRVFHEKFSSLPQVQGKQVKLINLAMGGYKQPQQLIAFALFGDQLDLAINIDGFNEVASLVYSKDFPLDYPLMSARYYYEGPGKIYGVLGFWLSLVLEKIYYRDTYNLNYHSSAFMNLAARSLFVLGHSIYRFLEDKFFQNFSGPRSWVVESRWEIRRAVGIWQNNLKDQYLLSQISGIPFFSFIQPNQYVESSKQLSSEERLKAFDRYMFQLNNRKYQQLLEGANDLRMSGIPVFSLTEIFKNVREQIYIDTCCHVNTLGNQIILDSILEIIKKNLQEQTQAIQAKASIF